MISEIKSPLASIIDSGFAVSYLGKNWRFLSPATVEELWEKMTPTDLADERIPYWAELWPASLGLAQWLAMRQAEIKHRCCLDLGCGLGLTAIFGQWLGAKVIACDYSKDALLAASKNAALNDAPQPVWLVCDWRKPALKKGCFWRIWAGDILYEKRAMPPVLDFLDYCLQPQGEAWIAEPGRAIFQQLINLCRERSWLIAPIFRDNVKAIQKQEAAVPVTIWSIKRAPGQAYE